jgi:RNase adaptor protein for sRNA GlmZ degradation
MTEKQLTIITFGKSFRGVPKESENNYDVSGLSENLGNSEMASHKADTRNRKYNKKVSQNEDFKVLYDKIITDIDNNNYKCISICCMKGKHRSVAMARVIAKKYPDSNIINLDIDTK